MAREDIYGNKKRFDTFIQHLPELLQLPLAANKKGNTRHYYIKNKNNLPYFTTLHKKLETRDLSYARRKKLFGTLLFVCHHTPKNLKDLRREDIDLIKDQANHVYQSNESLSDFIKDLKVLWKTLLPERDEKGREDETIVPYAVRHLKRKLDKSKEVLRNDRMTLDEYELLMDYFSKDPRTKFFFSLMLESLGRPQELSYLKLKRVEDCGHSAKIWVGEKGKEGVKLLQCIDSYPDFIQWMHVHPFKNDPEAYLFIANNKAQGQYTPDNFNKQLKAACKALKIKKNFSPYSIKRNGVTFAYMRGDNLEDIRMRAGWTTLKEFVRYNLAEMEDAYSRELEKRGLGEKDMSGRERFKLYFSSKTCACKSRVRYVDKECAKCGRIVDRNILKQHEREAEIEKQLYEVAFEITKQFKEESPEKYHETFVRVMKEKFGEDSIKKIAAVYQE